MKPTAADIIKKLQEVLSYEPSTGLFRWLVQRSNAAPKVGEIAGTIHPKGYRVIGFAGRYYKAHRMAVAFMTGGWPKGEVDHDNGQKDDNAWGNLIDTTHQGNMQNQTRAPKNSKTGVLGVSQYRDGVRFVAKIGLKGKKFHLGLFDTIELASAARTKAAQALHTQKGVRHG